MTTDQIIALLLEHRQEISAWFDPNDSPTDNTLDPVLLLPKNLRKKLRHRKAFRNAFSLGYISIDEGEVVSHFRSVAMLAYFCGRCFSDDTVLIRHRYRYIQTSDISFPAAELERFFGVSHLRDSRKNLMNKKIPAWYQTIDNLFII